MTESDFSNPSSSLPASGLGGAGMLGKGLSLVRSAAQAGTSLVKTQLLRQDRTTEAEYQHRMSICQSCPGGHATFHADGSLNTCGPMLKSMAGDGHGAKGGKEGAEKKTCGCVLSGKARDRKQGCPFSYWPPLPTLPEKAPASPATPGIPGVPAMAKAISGTSNGGVELYSPADQKRYEAAMAGGRSGHLGGVGGGGGYLLDPSRRRFLGQSAAAMVGLMATRLAFSDTEKRKYIPIDPCCFAGGNSSGNEVSKRYVLCGDVSGHRTGEVFKATDGKCYRVLTAKFQELSGIDLDLVASPAGPGQWHPSCNNESCCCQSPNVCSCDWVLNVTQLHISWTYKLCTSIEIAPGVWNPVNLRELTYGTGTLILKTYAPEEDGSNPDTCWAQFEGGGTMQHFNSNDYIGVPTCENPNVPLTSSDFSGWVLRFPVGKTGVGWRYNLPWISPSSCYQTSCLGATTGTGSSCILNAPYDWEEGCMTLTVSNSP